MWEEELDLVAASRGIWVSTNVHPKRLQNISRETFSFFWSKKSRSYVYNLSSEIGVCEK
jgi:hypothetical protein